MPIIIDMMCFTSMWSNTSKEIKPLLEQGWQPFGGANIEGGWVTVALVKYSPTPTDNEGAT